MVSFWHFAVPVIDDITDVLLLWYTYDSGYSGLWWLCLCVMVVSEVDRLFVVFQLATLTLALPAWAAWAGARRLFFAWTGGLPGPGVEVGALLSLVSLLNFGQEVLASNARGLLVDALLWVLLGARARSSDFMSSEFMASKGLVGPEPARVVEAGGHGLLAIDFLIRHHPFRRLGEFLFSCPYGHHLEDREGDASRRSEAVTKAVGETLVVDILFLALGVATAGWDGNFTGVTGVSALFSVLELVSELQYYVAIAASSMRERPSGPGLV